MPRKKTKTKKKAQPNTFVAVKLSTKARLDDIMYAIEENNDDGHKVTYNSVILTLIHHYEERE